MKLSTVLSIALFFTVALVGSQLSAQSSGKAADKQKQANLEKNKARQAELKKKYNSLTPEQAAEAKQRANEYKRSGGKSTAAPTAKPAPAAKPAATGVSGKTVPQGKQTTTATQAAKPKPVLMDANGKPVQKAATTSKPKTTVVAPAAPAGKGKTAVTPAAKPAQKVPATKVVAAPQKSGASEKINK